MANDDREGIALAQLAKLYKAAGRKESAAKCYETMLANRSADGDVSSREDRFVFRVLFSDRRFFFTRTPFYSNTIFFLPCRQISFSMALLTRTFLF